MAVRPAKTQMSLGIRPVRPESSLCAQWVAKDPNFLRANSEDSDQTGRMLRLIWVFAGRTAILLVLSCRGSDYFNNLRLLLLLPRHTLKIIWRDKNITLASKVKLMSRFISFTFMYACESWTLTRPCDEWGGSHEDRGCNYSISRNSGNPFRQKTNICVSGFSSEKTRYWSVGITFYFVKILYIEIAFFHIFFPIFQQIWQHFAHN